jgi:hypothetical protein
MSDRNGVDGGVSPAEVRVTGTDPVAEFPAPRNWLTQVRLLQPRGD